MRGSICALDSQLQYYFTLRVPRRWRQDALQRSVEVDMHTISRLGMRLVLGVQLGGALTTWQIRRKQLQ